MAIYKGEEKKLGIKLTAPGFDMDTDNFEVSVISSKVTISGAKGNPDPEAKIRIFKEDVSSSSSDSSSSGPSQEAEGEWFVIVDTSTLSTGPLRIVATAYVQDSNADDLVRKEIAVANWDTLTNP